MAQQLKKEERIKIQTLLENGSSIIQISKYLGRNRSTIHRELNRAGVVSDKYDAQMHHEQARKNMARRLERAPCKETISFIEAKILEQQWSPEQISNWLKINKQISVSHTWIYRYIAQDKKQGGELHNHMRRGTYLKGHKEYKGKIKDRVSIEERADVVNKRERLGDYEIDLIVGPKNKGAILTVIDRLSRFCVLKKLTSKNKEEVATEVITSLAEYKPKTITSDNGTEFTDHQDISKALNLKYYFAHPYASYEMKVLRI